MSFFKIPYVFNANDFFKKIRVVSNVFLRMSGKPILFEQSRIPIPHEIVRKESISSRLVFKSGVQADSCRKKIKKRRNPHGRSPGRFAEIQYINQEFTPDCAQHINSTYCMTGPCRGGSSSSSSSECGWYASSVSPSCRAGAC